MVSCPSGFGSTGASAVRSTTTQATTNPSNSTAISASPRNTNHAPMAAITIVVTAVTTHDPTIAFVSSAPTPMPTSPMPRATMAPVRPGS